MKIKPLSNNVIIEQFKEEEKTKEVFFFLNQLKEAQQGKVVSVGPGKTNNQGKVIPMNVKKGDIVLFSKYSPQEIKVEDKEYLVLKEEDILAIIE